MANVIPMHNSTSRCSDCLYSQNCILISNTGEISDAAMKSRSKVFHAGEALYRAGESVEFLYRVRTGTIKSVISRKDGQNQVTGFYGTGDWLGLDAVGQSSHIGDAVALDTVSVCVIPLQPVITHCSKSYDNLRDLMSILSQRLISNERLHMSLACDNAQQRLAQFLLRLSSTMTAAHLHADDINLSMSRQDIASYLALAIETVSRLLTRMQKQGLIHVDRTRIEIIDRQGLIEFAGGELPQPSEEHICHAN